MSAPPPSCSSGTAECGEETLVAGDDACDVRRVGRRIPHVALKCAAEEDAVGARQHVAEVSLGCVANLRLRFEDRKLASDRLKQLVAKQLTASKPSAVEDEVLGQ